MSMPSGKQLNFDFHAIHDNILKLDIRKYDDPTMIRKTPADLSGMDASTIPMDDPEVMKIFAGTEVPCDARADFFENGHLGVPEMGPTSFVAC